MSNSLTDLEIRELSAVFHAPEAARQLLEAAGLPRGRQPGWQERSAEEFWREVDVLLRSGVLAGGRGRVLDAARRTFPANPVFMAESPDNVTDTPTLLGERPDTDGPPGCDAERASGPTVTMNATVHGGGRVFQAGRDLYIADE
jgi:Effector-associated domain 1